MALRPVDDALFEPIVVLALVLLAAIMATGITFAILVTGLR